MMHWRLKRINNQIKALLLNTIFRGTVKFIPRQTIVIFGDPRGGSTWVTEFFENQLKAAVIWEPLAVSGVQELKKLNFGWRQFLPVNYNSKEIEEYFKKVFKGQILTSWTVLHSSLFKFLSAKHLIVKFCRANAMIPWIVENFDFKYKPIYLIRHPLAVVSSQLKQGGWDFHFDKFEIPNSLYNEHYTKHELFLSSIHSKAEALLCTWCITNEIALKELNNNNRVLKINYESLFLNPEQNLKRVFDTWGIDDSFVDYSIIKRKSATTIASSKLSPRSHLKSWVKTFTGDELIRFQEILDYFGIIEYNTKQYFPLKYGE